METATIDTVAAYLYQDYPSDVTPLYVKLPRLVAEICSLDPNQTYRVRKYIYGLPDAGRAYYLSYRHHLLSNGYLSTASDPCLFVKFSGHETTYVWFHVDDTFIASTTRKGIDDFAEVLRYKFQITMTDTDNHYLGINMKKLADGSTKLEQSKLLNQIFDEYPPEELRVSKGIPVPMRSIEVTSIADDALDESEEYEERVNEYLHLLGMLNYLTKSRPDICTALSFAATHSRNPHDEHFLQLLDVVRYLWDTKHKSLIIRSGDGFQPLTLTCYVDASYLTHEDSRSHSGYCMSFGSVGTFYVKSSKQQLVATSSTHAEIRALYQLVLDIVYVVNLCDELCRPVRLPAIVFEDNQPAIDLSATLSGRVKRCKHFLMLISYIREQVASGLIEIQKIPTADNPADVLTKRIVGTPFLQKADYLLGVLDEHVNSI
jgi:histone deacetylase 1/2